MSTAWGITSIACTDALHGCAPWGSGRWGWALLPARCTVAARADLGPYPRTLPTVPPSRGLHPNRRSACRTPYPPSPIHTHPFHSARLVAFSRITNMRHTLSMSELMTCSSSPAQASRRCAFAREQAACSVDNAGSMTLSHGEQLHHPSSPPLDRAWTTAA